MHYHLPSPGTWGLLSPWGRRRESWPEWDVSLTHNLLAGTNYVVLSHNIGTGGCGERDGMSGGHRRLYRRSQRKTLCILQNLGIWPIREFFRELCVWPLRARQTVRERNGSTFFLTPKWLRTKEQPQESAYFCDSDVSRVKTTVIIANINWALTMC